MSSPSNAPMGTLEPLTNCESGIAAARERSVVTEPDLETDFERIRTSLYTEAFQSCTKIEGLESSRVGKFTGPLLRFLRCRCGDDEEDLRTWTTHFEEVAQSFLNIADLETFRDFEYYLEMSVLIVLVELHVTFESNYDPISTCVDIKNVYLGFREFLIWFFSTSEKYQSPVDFIRCRFEDVNPEEVMRLHIVLGRVFGMGEVGRVFGGEAEEDDENAQEETLSIAADHLRECGRIFSTMNDLECASGAYCDAVRVAINSKNLEKAVSILMDALEALLAQDGEEVDSLWVFVKLVSDKYLWKKEYIQAIELLKKGLELAWKVSNANRRWYRAVHMEWTLGHAFLVLCSYDDVGSPLQAAGFNHLRTALGNLGDAPNAERGNLSLEDWTFLRKGVGVTLANELISHNQFREAQEQIDRMCCQSLTNSKEHYLYKSTAACAQFESGAQAEGLKAFEEVLASVKNDSTLQCDEVFQAELLATYALLLDRHGDDVKRNDALKRVRSLLQKNPDFLKRNFDYWSRCLPKTLEIHLANKDISSAFGLFQDVEPAMMSSNEASQNSSTFNLVLAKLFNGVNDVERAEEYLESYQDIMSGPTSDEMEPELADGQVKWEEKMLRHKRRLEETDKLSSTRRFENKMIVASFLSRKEMGYEGLREVMALGEELPKNFVEGLDSALLVWSYIVNKKHSEAEEECEIAIKRCEAMEESHPHRSLALANLYKCKAIGAMQLQDCDKAKYWIEKARPLVNGASFLVRLSAMIATHEEQGAEKEEDILKEVINLSAKEQRQYSSTMDSAWIWTLESNVMFYGMMERLLNRKAEHPLEALLWAERSRMRLFMHVSAERAEASSHASKFDENDEYAKDVVKGVVGQCGCNVAIIEYSYAKIEGLLFVYLVCINQTSGELKVSLIQCINLDDEVKEKWHMSPEELVDNVRLAITDASEEGDRQAKIYLTYLHDLLFPQRIRQPLKYHFHTLGLAPQGPLSFLPFHALYDSVEGQYLIQQFKIFYIPSLRTLGHCFDLQLKRPTWRSSTNVGRAFVAGNPFPMGRNEAQLDGAEQEAKEVAKILGVRPCVREQMTKGAVKEGLCGNSVVLLATHARYDPEGALVLRAVDDRHNSTDPDVLIHTDIEETLSAQEISKLPVNAGLVVLDGCETGKGKVTSEGVIGLGRSVLQAGASTVVLSLWKVHDETTKTLITGALYLLYILRLVCSVSTRFFHIFEF
jgi:CHAT domain-containing protein